MRKEMIIRVQASFEKGHAKAIKVAAAIPGVESVTIAGEDRNLLLVIGVGIDSNRITKKLRRKVGHAEVVELRSVDSGADELGLGALVAADHHTNRYPLSPSPYKQNAVARDHHHYYGTGAGGGGYPRDHYYYNTGAGYPRDYYYYGGYQQPQPQQRDYYSYSHYPAPAANTQTVVHHEYAAGDPNGCSVM